MDKIKYYSTNLNSQEVTFREALLKGQAPDKGLYMPIQIPQFTKDELENFTNQSYPELAFTVANKYLHDVISKEDLRNITTDAYNFDVPLENVSDRKYIMRLDQGPTASFKDFAARMMGRLMQYFLKKENRKILILTATSGDTGSAIANAFYKLENIQVVVLFPEKEVTDRQRRQMTTLHKNIRIIALDGKFDDCQALVKKAFADSELDTFELSSANSINIGRLLPQSMYYIYAWSRLANDLNDKIIFSVPSGNFGDLMGGLIAMKMGLPIERFIVSTNENDEVPIYWQTGDYNMIVPSINCISSAMNVGHPSNLARIVALYGGVMNEKGEILKVPDLNLMRKEMYAVSITDKETKETIKEVYDKYKVIMEPHGSVGWAGLEQYLESLNAKNSNQLCVSLETAHPAKFPEEIKKILNIVPELPKSLLGLDEKEERFNKMEHDYEVFKKFIKENYE